MKFCPSCEIRLKKDDSGLTCTQCGYVEGNDKKTTRKSISKKDAKPSAEFNVFEKNEGTETLPTTNILCGKCGHGQAVWWMLQTRSADEPTTQFYRCAKCNHTWRNYG